MQLLTCQKCQQETSLYSKPVHSIDPQLLRTDYVPSDAEASETVKYVEEEEYELARVKRVIVGLRWELDRLEKRERALVDNLARRHSINSPQRRVPAEVWRIIFGMVCSTSGYSFEIDNEGNTTPRLFVILPVTIGHVCSRWRDIVHAYPRLWSSISVNFCYLRTGSLNILNLFLKYSRHDPLTIRIKRPFGYLSDREKEAWRAVASHFWRAEHLVVDIECFDILSVTVDHQISFPNLVTYEGDVPEFGVTDPSWGEAIRDATKLKAMVTISVQRPSTLPYQQLSSLTILNVPHPSLEMLTRILSSCQNLEFLSIACVVSGQGQAPLYPVQSMEMPKLRTLIINGHGTFDEIDLQTRFMTELLRMDSPMLTSFLDSLTAPSLETFELQCPDFSPTAEWPPALMGMLQRSSKTLNKLSLRLAACINSPNRNRVMSTLLEQVPNLTCFEVDMVFSPAGGGLRDAGDDSDWNNWIVKDLFWKLGRPDRFPNLAPNLTTISFRMTDLVLSDSDIQTHLKVYQTHDVLDTVLRAAAWRSPVSIARRDVPSGRQPLTSIRIVRILCHEVGWPPMKADAETRPVPLRSHFLENIQSLEKDGVKVVVQEVGNSAETYVY
ncbi:hypothetical protein V5O48_012022 [Marasmius crinis-equi]|uniref:F-box domain-containing protein n=1 Tax=Marasmius crinis-equi TaxID=585013 RepID=A0ABR3F3X8_9AGAR